MSKEPIMVTLHLPGLKKTVEYSFSTPITNKQLADKIAADFGQESRRASVSILGESFFGEIGASQLWLHSTPRVKNGDTLILCIRETIVQNQNDYYETQKDSLLHNKYLNPPIPKKIAIDLLMQIDNNFDLLGYKYYLPGTRLHEYRTTLEKELSEFYPA